MPAFYSSAFFSSVAIFAYLAIAAYLTNSGTLAPNSSGNSIAFLRAFGSGV